MHNAILKDCRTFQEKLIKGFECKYPHLFSDHTCTYVPQTAGLCDLASAFLKNHKFSLWKFSMGQFYLLRKKMRTFFSALVLIFMLFFTEIGKYRYNNPFAILGTCRSVLSIWIISFWCDKCCLCFCIFFILQKHQS